jgi:hypothetical protein
VPSTRVCVPPASRAPAPANEQALPAGVTVRVAA